MTQLWLKRLENVMEASLLDARMSNEQIALQMLISERDLHRKVKQMTGMSPQKYLRRYRLQRARQLLIDGAFRTVREAGRSIGYTNISYFITQFENAFGMKPLKILKEHGWR